MGVGGGGRARRLGNPHSPTPTSLHIFDRRPLPWYKSLSLASLPLPLTSKIAAMIFAEKIQSTRQNYACSTGQYRTGSITSSLGTDWPQKLIFRCFSLGALGLIATNQYLAYFVLFFLALITALLKFYFVTECVWINKMSSSTLKLFSPQLRWKCFCVSFRRNISGQQTVSWRLRASWPKMT